MRAVRIGGSPLSLIAVGIGAGASVGAASIVAVASIDALTGRSAPLPSIPETLLVTLLGSVPKFTFGLYFRWYANHHYLFFCPRRCCFCGRAPGICSGP